MPYRIRLYNRIISTRKTTVRLAALLLAFVFCIPAGLAENVLPGSGIVTNCTENVNLRAEPSAESKLLGTVPLGTELSVLGLSDDGAWYRVSRDDLEGWINGYYVALAGERPLSEYTEAERYALLFDAPVTYWTTDHKPSGYRSKENALAHTVQVSVKVWVSGSRGRRVSATRKVRVHKKLAAEVKQIFKEIYALEEKFPIDTLVGFRWNSRGEVSGPLLDGTTVMSAHAYGAAIDINMYQNDYYVGAGQDCRDPKNKFFIPDSVKEIFARHGWYWGGDFSICTDTMHFQYVGLDMLSYNNGSPFTAYSLETTPGASSSKLKNIQRRLKKLGYSVSANGKMSAKTDAAIRAFQRDRGLPENGVTDEAFYIALYNETTTMYD